MTVHIAPDAYLRMQGERDAERAKVAKLREALEAVDSEVLLTGQIKEIVDEALAKTES